MTPTEPNPPDGDQPPEDPPSGLQNPGAAVRGAAAGLLAVEALVLLLAIQPIRVLGGSLSGAGVAAVITLAVVALVIAASMRRRWAWIAGTVLQIALLACGLLHWSLGVLGVVFGLVWLYSLNVRRTVLGKRR